MFSATKPVTEKKIARFTFFFIDAFFFRYPFFFSHAPWFAFTLVEIHVVLPSYVKNFLGMGGNIFASAEIYYSFGAIFSGLLILRLFKKFNTVIAIIILMLIVSFAFFLMFLYDILWIFFLGNFLLGITNADWLCLICSRCQLLLRIFPDMMCPM